MPTTFRVGTFNLQNLFSRAKVLNLQDHELTKDLLEKIERLAGLLRRASYSAADKKEIARLAAELDDYVIIREDRGKLFTGRGTARRVTAAGAEAWDGALEFRREKISDQARDTTAAVVRALEADVLCGVEIEDRLILRDFDSQLLGKKKFGRALLIDGNDERGIDVGLLSRFEIARLRTHIFDRDKTGPIFSRDCLEVEVLLPGGRPLHVLCNHLKSQGYGSPAANNAKRLRQTKRIAEILKGYDLTKELVVVAGDLNDKPDSAGLSPLLKMPNLFDVLAQQFPKTEDRWTYRYRNQLDQIDYLLVSKPLRDAFRSARVERRGIHGIEKLTGEKPFPSLTRPTTAASDHAAVVAEFAVK